MKSKQICLKQTIVLSKQIFSEIPFATCFFNFFLAIRSAPQKHCLGRIRQFLVPVRNIGNLVSNRYYEYLLACNKKNSWWFQTVFTFTSTWGRFPLRLYINCFSIGWEPPTRKKIGRSKQDKEKGSSHWPFSGVSFSDPSICVIKSGHLEEVGRKLFYFFFRNWSLWVIMVFFWRHETPPQKNIWSVDSSEGAGFDSDSTSRAPENQLIHGAIKPL